MSVSGTGLRDWLIQRVTAVFLTFYSLFLFFYVVFHKDFSYESWVALFLTPWMQISTLFALLCIALHAWIGLWTVCTDYLKCTAIRYLVLTGIVIALFSYLVWGIIILWG